MQEEVRSESFVCHGAVTAAPRGANRSLLFEAVVRQRAGDDAGALHCLSRVDFAALPNPGEADAAGHKFPAVSVSVRSGSAAVHAANGHVPGPAESRGSRDYAELTPRQRDVLRAVSGGASNRAAALMLDLTENTVKWHLKKAFARLGVRNRCAALGVAQARGLLG